MGKLRGPIPFLVQFEVVEEFDPLWILYDAGVWVVRAERGIIPGAHTQRSDQLRQHSAALEGTRAHCVCARQGSFVRGRAVE